MHRLFEWYWKEKDGGINRQGRYKISLGDWLDKVARLADRSHSMSKAFAGGRKGCLAVWGPSQTGKSTLLSRYIDVGGIADPSGAKSALTWPGGVNARFCPVSQEAMVDYPDTIILNPFRFGSDASGVATRYVLREDSDIADAAHPVELYLTTEEQLLHAIAAGYLYETDARSSDGRKVSWEKPAIEKIIEQLPQPQADATPCPKAFELLRAGFSAVESMLKSNDDRFVNLNIEGLWGASLRPALINNPRLHCSYDNALKFIQNLLWDGHVHLNELHRRLKDKMDVLATTWGGKTVFCSLAAAAIILDIDSWSAFLKNDPQKKKSIHHISVIRWQLGHECILIDCNGSAGSNEILGKEFGLFQAVVGELVVPLRAEALRLQGGPFLDFITENDIIDFPGVPNQDNNIAKDAQISLKELKADAPELLTRLFKRGKTLSVVASKARELAIDAFAILVRATNFISKPGQLAAGINQWLAYFDPHFQGLHSNGAPPLPIHVVFTFFGAVVNQCHEAGAANISEVANRLRDLGQIASPGHATFHLTTYKHFADGRLITELDTILARNKVKNSILASQEFNSRLPNVADSLSAVMETEDGGTNIMFDQLKRGVSHHRRYELYAKLAAADLALAHSLMDSALPGKADNLAQKRKDALNKAAKKLEAECEAWDQDETKIMDIGYHASRIIFFEPDSIEQPPNLNSDRLFTDYVARHFEKWVQSGMTLEGNFPFDIFGMADEADRRLILSAIADSADFQALAEFIKKEFRGVRQKDSKWAIATAISNLILHGKIHIPPRSLMDPVALLSKMENPQNYKDVPHYPKIIKPVIDMFARSAKINAMAPRPGQPGDEELLLLRSSPFYTFIN